MKKLLVLALVAIFAVSCSNKNDRPWQDSNTMLEEPGASATDSSSQAAAAPAPAADSAAPADSASVK